MTEIRCRDAEVCRAVSRHELSIHGRLHTSRCDPGQIPQQSINSQSSTTSYDSAANDETNSGNADPIDLPLREIMRSESDLVSDAENRRKQAGPPAIDGLLRLEPESLSSPELAAA